jgi:hypothetical protein
VCPKCRELARGGDADAIKSVIGRYYDMVFERTVAAAGPVGGPASVHECFESLLK